ncbi:hypothetical protein F5884DRAFT_204199 [Xylogone sp. PMI_703]|nr:hypothetical protein F5884DRAFT_204199 [Xylogone sp. PMI_703]
MAPLDNLAPPGTSTYSSNTMTVGDGTWDASRNDFLLPNLVGLNFATMRYNGMGNRFASMPQYHSLIKGHGIVAAITFLFFVPFAIFFARFPSRRPGRSMRFHIYFQVMTLLLSTVVFILGFQAVGPKRALTNPHHGIGVAIYVMILVQALYGSWVYGREKGRSRMRQPLKIVLHQWFGRAIALLGFAQIPLGLTLYGSPKSLFVLYALWMAFLLLLYFILDFRNRGPIRPDLISGRRSSRGGTVITESTEKRGRFGSLIAPLAAGAGIAALLGRRRHSRSRSRSQSRRDEVLPSRRGSDSYFEEEKIEHRKKDNDGMMDRLFKGAAILGAGALAKSWYDRRKQKNEEERYSSVAPDTPSRHRYHEESVFSDETMDTHHVDGRRPTNPAAATTTATGTVLSTTDTRPMTPRPARTSRRDSYDSLDYSEYTYTSPSRRQQEESGGLGKGLLAGLGLGWFAKRMKDRRDKKEEQRLQQEQDERMEEERQARLGNRSRLTGDGFPSPHRQNRRQSRIVTESDLSSITDDPHTIGPGSSIPPVPPPAMGGRPVDPRPSAGGSRPVAMPAMPPDPHGILHADSGSEAYYSGQGRTRRSASRRRRERTGAPSTIVPGSALTPGSVPAAESAITAGSALAGGEEAARRREDSRSRVPSQVASPPVSVKVRVDHDRDRNVTLRRLTEQEAAAEREARRAERRRRADSASSISGTESGRRRYRRDPSASGSRRTDASVPPPLRPAVQPIPPPPIPTIPQVIIPDASVTSDEKTPTYYPPARPGTAGRPSTAGRPDTANTQGTSVASRESHGTWSGITGTMLSADRSTTDVDERRRRRRLERQQRDGMGSVNYE